MDLDSVLKLLPSPAQHAVILMVLGGGLALGWAHFDAVASAASQTAIEAKDHVSKIDARLHDIEQKQTVTEQKLDDLKDDQRQHNQQVDDQLNRIETLLETSGKSPPH